MFVCLLCCIRMSVFRVPVLCVCSISMSELVVCLCVSMSMGVR